MPEKLRLRAADPEDLAVIAACLQDARISLNEMVYLPAERRFAAMFARYRREHQLDPLSCEGLTECQSALVFEEIDAVKHRRLGAAGPNQELVLLTIATEPGRDKLIHVDLVFQGDAVIQLRTDRIACRLEDVGAPVPSRITPCDHFAQEFWEQVDAAATRS